jgi:hypothetical protein
MNVMGEALFLESTSQVQTPILPLFKAIWFFEENFSNKDLSWDNSEFSTD